MPQNDCEQNTLASFSEHNHAAAHNISLIALSLQRVHRHNDQSQIKPPRHRTPSQLAALLQDAPDVVRDDSF